MNPIRIPLDNVDSRRVLAGAGAVARAMFAPLAITAAVLILVALLFAYHGLRREVDELRARVEVKP